MQQIGIVNTKVCNLKSVQTAFEAIGVTSKIVESPTDIIQCSHIVLPGVGCFVTCMRHLAALQLTQALNDTIQSGKPVLGICLGLQLLADTSSEFGHEAGLKYIHGKVEKLPMAQTNHLPHVGWNYIKPNHHALFKNLPQDPMFYFSHSYHILPTYKKNVLAECKINNYHFAAAVGENNVVAVQFHPEKSGHNGRQLLKNFVEMDAIC